MVEPILYAIPAFVLLLAVELWSFRVAAAEGLVGCELRDARSSLTRGAGDVAINAVWKLAVIHTERIGRLPAPIELAAAAPAA